MVKPIKSLGLHYNSSYQRLEVLRNNHNYGKFTLFPRILIAHESEVDTEKNLG